MKKPTPLDTKNGIGSMVIQLAAHKVPLFVEGRNGYQGGIGRDGDFIIYGWEQDDTYWNNRYCDYLLQLFNRSSKNGAIISGKAKYIYGNGFDEELKGVDDIVKLKVINWLKTINPKYDADELAKRIELDFEIFGGFYLLIVPNKKKTGIAAIYHKDWSDYRIKNKDMDAFIYCDSWDPNIIANPKLHESWKEYPAFEEGKYNEPSIFCYRQYRPGLKTYPLPEYVSGCADIETSVEISNYDLNNVKNGFWGGKIISYNNGVPEESTQADVERKLKRKFSGTDNANKFLVNFSNGKDNAVTVEDISQTNADKIFETTDPRVSEGIFVAHKVTSPMLFGIKTEGQLGGSQELLQSWAIFQANYIAPRQAEIEKVFNYFASIAGLPEVIKIQPLKFPIVWSENVLSANLTKDEIRVEAGYDPLVVEAAPAPQLDEQGNPIALPQPLEAVNDNLKNLTAKQHQQINRIVRQFTKQVITEPMAKAMLKSGFGLSDSDINAFLGLEANDDVEMMKFYQVQNEKLLKLFSEFGMPRSKVSLIARRFNFAEDEQYNFYGADVLSKKEVQVLAALADDKLVDLIAIAAALNISVKILNDIIAGLKDSGYVETSKGKTKTIYTITSKGSDIIAAAPKSVSIKTVYSYQVRPNMGETLIEGSRDFCRKMISLDRVYSKADIQTISEREGYDVFQFTGGWYTKKGGVQGPDTTPYCRHKWAKELVYVNND